MGRALDVGHRGDGYARPLLKIRSRAECGRPGREHCQNWIADWEIGLAAGLIPRHFSSKAAARILLQHITRNPKATNRALPRGTETPVLNLVRPDFGMTGLCRKVNLSYSPGCETDPGATVFLFRQRSGSLRWSHWTRNSMHAPLGREVSPYLPMGDRWSMRNSTEASPTS